MKEKSESLKAADFFEKLQHDKLETTVPFSMVGMVKKSEGKEKTIEFAPGVNCSNWVTIPLEFIEDVEMMKTIACKDHSHPLVKLNMKKPITPEGKIFFALLEGMKHRIEGRQNNHYMPPSKPMNLQTMSRINRPQVFGGFGGGLGMSVGGGLNYDCSSDGCWCTGLSDCLQMCWETDTCWHGRCIDFNGRLFCPWG